MALRLANNRSSTQAPSSSALVQSIVESAGVIAETASDAIITINEESTILFVNRATSNIFGYTTEELIGSQLTMLMPEYLRHIHSTGLRDYIATGQKHISWEAVELPGLHKSGKELILELSFGEFQKDGYRFFTGIARDIGRRKGDEQRLKLQHSMTEILAGASTLDEAAPKLLSAIARHLGWQFAAFWSVQSNQNELHSIAKWRDESSPGTIEFAEASSQLRVGGDASFPARIWATKKPLWLADFSSDESFPRAAVAARGNLHSAFGFPVIAAEKVVGVIELFSEKNDEPDSATLTTLVSIGSQVGQFIERVNAESERREGLTRAQEARREAEALTDQLAALQKVTDAALGHLSINDLLAESLKRIREVLHVDTVAILLLEREENELVAWAAQGLEEEVELGVRIPVGRGFAGKIIANVKPIIISEVENADLFNPLLREKGIQSLLGVPMMIEGRPIGVLHVGAFKHTNFTEEQVGLLQSAADRLVLAVENARLYQVEQSARAEAEAANRAKDEFLTILSHELRTPLTPIIGWVHMMENGILPDSDFQKALGVINKNAYNLKRLISDLLDMSAILSGKMRIEEHSVAIAAVLEESVETMRAFASQAKVDLKLEMPREMPAVTIKGDRNRLNQIFCNVLHNAIKFSPPGAVVKAALTASDSDAIVTISDQGEGIPADFLPHVFERFRQADGSRTRSYGGLGLGLSLVKSFVSVHGGTIEVDSDGAGKGSTFIITLPREGAPKHSSAKTSKRSKADAVTALRILIVEDQPDTLEMLAATFRSRGFETIACESASEAIDCVDRQQFDILISDIAMPEMDGLQLIREVRSRPGLATVPAIALTGYASQTDAKSAIAAGFDLHLSKPIDPGDLMAAVHNLIALRSRGKT
ncbi:MAG: GAF domain-containing protein [bacterium]